jgi:hypothetical protein
VPAVGTVTVLDERMPLAWATVAMGHTQVAASAWGHDFRPNPAQYYATFILFSEFQFSNLNYRKFV